MNILVLGIGQSLRSDDGAGLEAVRLWQARYPETAARVQVELCELPGLALLELLEGRPAAVLVDAFQAELPAGSLLRVGPQDLAAFTPGSGSAHGWGAAETLALGRSLDPRLRDCQVTLIGIAAGTFAPGQGLSTAVQEGLAAAAEAVQAEVQALLAGRTGEEPARPE